MKIVVFKVFIILAINFATSQVLKPAKLKIVSTQYGKVQGIQKQTMLGRDYFSFQSIPYMKAPLGKLRFRDPQPPAKWTNILDATQEPPGYPAFDSYSRQLVGQEDAAVINVYTPFINAYFPLPVIVWIHGGSYHVSNFPVSVQKKYNWNYYMRHRKVIWLVFFS